MNNAGMVELQSVLRVAGNTLDRAIRNRATLEKTSDMLCEALSSIPHGSRSHSQSNTMVVETDECSLCKYDTWRYDTDMRCIESDYDCSTCGLYDDCKCRDCGAEHRHFKLAWGYAVRAVCPICHVRLVGFVHGGATRPHYCPNCGTILYTTKEEDKNASKSN